MLLANLIRQSQIINSTTKFPIREMHSGPDLVGKVRGTRGVSGATVIKCVRTD